MSIAEDVLEGSQCQLRGTCFMRPHGYPVTCRSCWREMTPWERKDYTKATFPECGDKEPTS